MTSDGAVWNAHDTRVCPYDDSCILCLYSLDLFCRRGAKLEECLPRDKQ